MSTAVMDSASPQATQYSQLFFRGFIFCVVVAFIFSLRICLAQVLCCSFNIACLFASLSFDLVSLHANSGNIVGFFLVMKSLILFSAVESARIAME